MIINAVTNLRKQVIDDSLPSQKTMLISSILADEIAKQIRPFLEIKEADADNEYSRKFKTKIEVSFCNMLLTIDEKDGIINPETGDDLTVTD